MFICRCSFDDAQAVAVIVHRCLLYSYPADNLVSLSFRHGSEPTAYAIKTPLGTAGALQALMLGWGCG